MVENVNPDEQAAADALDVAIDDALGGDRTDPTLSWLSAAFTVVPPAATTERVAARLSRAAGPVPVRRRRSTVAGRDLWRWPRIAAAVLGLLLMFQGASSLTSGAWIAENIGEPFAPHAVAEGGFALIAVGFVALVASLDRQWVVLAVAAGVPLGIMLGVHGLREVNVWAWGAALHVTEGVVAVALLVSFVIAWRGRDRSGRRSKRKVD
ncbi:hypothetical protein GOARA_051_00220 [Gordonia araii NBRC 100433]|uniref:Uncharacterized protein n=1 Tax=Gordonia araii NBRC 100433 TaxID=1073574 RepID=G7H2K3_9ACTN|nr:hypothetical protein [Gordonia araii]NNG97734.1 hypothetical protein [Gordonia araii NBRC 100433]GAB10078.1 hypothetical protein GOARA_051_00220 [Gordonia araii NBRC 100433]